MLGLGLCGEDLGGALELNFGSGLGLSLRLGVGLDLRFDLDFGLRLAARLARLVAE